MIDTEARRRAATLLRQFADGEITNDDFHDARPLHSKDWALRAIFDEVWFYYDDLSNHRLVGKHALDDDGRALFRRCELFLLSDLEYGYPNLSPIRGLGGLVANILSLGLYRLFSSSERRYAERMEAAGDMDVWPFLSRADYERAKAASDATSPQVDNI